MLVAVDTNVLLDLALGVEDVRDAIAIIRERDRKSRFLITPTVAQELMWQASRSEDAAKRKTALTALESLWIGVLKS